MRRGIRFWTIIGALATGAAMAPATVNAQSGGTRHVAIGYDHIPNVQGGRPTGFAVIGEQETVVEHVTIVVGTSFHRISDTGRYGGTVGTASATQLFAGAGPGFRYQAAEKIAVVGHALRVRLFFVEDFSPYSWALLPANASLQWPFRGGTSSRPARAGVFPAASRASRRRTPSVFSPTGALPSGHSRGVLVRCRGKGGRPAMAVTTGFQGRTFDVPRTCVPCIDPPRRAPCATADAVFADAKAFLSSSEARRMSESELERELHRRGQELVRKLLQGHRDQRSPKEAAGPAEGKGTSGVECSEPREHESHAETASGTMQVVGLGCARRGHDGLHRLDAALNLLPERYLVEMRRRVTIATASRAPPRTPWKPPWYSTSSTWQRRRGVRCSSPAHRRACRHLVRDPMGDDRRTVTLGSSCGGPQPPRVAGALMRTAEEPGQRGAGARPGQAAVTGALSHASCSPPHRSTRPGALCGGGGFFRGDQSLPFFARGPADA